MIKKIIVSNYKGIRDTPLIIDYLDPINVFTGEPNTGKSSVLEYISCSEDNGNALINNDLRHISIFRTCVRVLGDDVFRSKVVNELRKLDKNIVDILFKLNPLHDKAKHKNPKNYEMDIKLIMHNGDLVEYEVIGNGTIKMIYTLCMIVDKETEVICIDNIEDSLHPSYLRLLVDLIVDSDDKQFFITTNSHDMIKRLCIAAFGTGSKMNLCRLRKTFGKNRYSRYDIEDLVSMSLLGDTPLL